MGALTTDERKLFTIDQLNQLARLSQTRRDEYLDPGEDGGDAATYRAMVLGKLAKRTSDQLRARVNIISVNGSNKKIVNWAPECNYTNQQKEAIEQGLRSGDKWADRAAEIVAAGPSIDQRIRKLEKA